MVEHVPIAFRVRHRHSHLSFDFRHLDWRCIVGRGACGIGAVREPMKGAFRGMGAFREPIQIMFGFCDIAGRDCRILLFEYDRVPHLTPRDMPISVTVSEHPTI